MSERPVDPALVSSARGRLVFVDVSVYVNDDERGNFGSVYGKCRLRVKCFMCVNAGVLK